MVFGLFKKKQRNLSDLFDFHNHLVFGIDDGAFHAEESLEMLTMYQDAGYSHVSVSNHLFHPMFPDSTVESIREGVEKLKTIVEEHNINIQLFPGAEIYYKEDFFEHLDAGNILTVADKGKGGYLLIEFSPMDPMFTMKELAFEISIRGYRPLLAHPERYPAIVKEENTAQEWKDAGWHFQLNMGSLLAKDSKGKVAKMLLKRGIYDVAASDLHHASPGQNLLDTMVKKLQKEVGDEHAEHLLHINPQRIFEGKHLRDFD